MPPPVTVEHVSALAAQLPPAERLRLVEQIVHDLTAVFPGGELAPQADWMAVRGIAPDLLEGEDAQEWVSRTRREGDRERENQWGRKP